MPRWTLPVVSAVALSLAVPSTADARLRLGPGAVLGERCVVGRGARVTGAVLWDHVSVGDGAVLHDCIIASGARIGAGARVGPGVVIEADHVVGEHARLP